MLKADGVKGVYCQVCSSNVDAVEFYTKLGFSGVPLAETLPNNVIILGRKI